MQKPSERLQRQLDAHKLWLDSGHSEGARLVIDAGSTDEEDFNFHRLDLAGIDLREAGLEFADFEGSDLSRARFDRANLVAARFSRCTLDGANFCKADLFLAYFVGARTDGARFDDADCQFTAWTKTDVEDQRRYFKRLHKAKLLQENRPLTP